MFDKKQNGEKSTKPIYSLEEKAFKEYFQKLEADDQDYEISCYRVSRKGNKTYKTWLRSYENEIPETQEIAETYGGGCFWMVAYDTENKKLERTIWIDELWTRKLEQSRRVEPGPPAAPFQGTADSLEYFKTIVQDIVKPMMQAVQGSNNNQKPNQPDEVMNIMTGVLETMTVGFANNMNRIQQTMLTKQLEKIETPMPEIKRDTTAEMGDKIRLIKEVLQWVKDWGSTFFKMSGEDENKIKNIIFKDERFKKLQDEPSLLDLLYTEACSNPEIGKDIADKLFSKLGFDLPETSTETATN